MKFAYEYYTLKNGLRVFLMPSDAVSSATVLAMVKSGSANETDEDQGISHLIEHVSLTALKSLPTKEALNEATELLGARFNASTGLQVVNYHINVPYTKVDFGIKFIYETLYECTLNDEYIEQERKIILDEISKIEDSVDYQNNKFVWDNLTEKNSGYIRPIGGTLDSVKSFSLEKVKDYYKMMHSPNKVLFSVVGNFNVDEVKKQISDLFEKIEKTAEDVEYPNESFKSGIVKVKQSPKSDLAMTTIEIPSLSSPEQDEKETNYIVLLETILSGPMSSRLKKRLREKENLLYHIQSGVAGLQTFGYSYIEYDIPKEQFDKTLRIVIEEFEKFYNDGITEKELAHYKEYITNRILIGHDTVYQYAAPIRSDLFWNRKILDLDQVIDVIKNATVEDVNTMIKKCMDINKINAFAFGNVDDETEKSLKENLKKYL
jgi:predicted Zn-dependent peptidase